MNQLSASRGTKRFRWRSLSSGLVSLMCLMGCDRPPKPEELVGCWRQTAGGLESNLAYEKDGTWVAIYSGFTNAAETGSWRLTNRQLNLTTETSTLSPENLPLEGTMTIKKLDKSVLVATSSSFGAGAQSLTLHRSDTSDAGLSRMLIGTWMWRLRGTNSVVVRTNVYLADGAMVSSMESTKGTTNKSVKLQGQWKVDHGTLITTLTNEGPSRRLATYETSNVVVLLTDNVLFFRQEGKLHMNVKVKQQP